MTRYSEKQLSEQEGLTPGRLSKIFTGYNITNKNRPSDSLIELIHWAKDFICSFS